MLRSPTPRAALVLGACLLAACAGRFPQRAWRAPRPGSVSPPAPRVAVGRETPAVESPAGQPTGALRARVDAVAQAFRERNAHPLAERWVTFLPPQGTATMRVSLDRDGCLGFIAVGRESLTNVDLFVYNAAGLRLAQDDREDAHPYVRICLRASQMAFVLVQAAAGAGEVAVLTLADPPLVAPNLDALLGTRPGTLVGPRTPRMLLGSDPSVPDAARALDLALQRLTPLGYRRVGAISSGLLPMRQQVVRPVRLDAGTCYAIVAAGGRGVEDLDLFVTDPAGRETLARDVATDNHPLVRFCPERSANYSVRVVMYSGAGTWALAVLAMDPAIELPADIVGDERAGALEIAAEGRRRGMALLASPLRVALLPEPAARFALTLRAGRCYLIGAAPSAGTRSIHLSLLDDHGAVVSADASDESSTRVFYCARRSMRARAEVRGFGEWVAGRAPEYVLLALESRDANR